MRNPVTKIHNLYRPCEKHIPPTMLSSIIQTSVHSRLYERRIAKKKYYANGDIVKSDVHKVFLEEIVSACRFYGEYIIRKLNIFPYFLMIKFHAQI